MGESLHTPASRGVGLSFRLEAWAAWAPGLEDESGWRAWAGGPLPGDDGSAPSVGFVDPMIRRRLDRLSRMVLCVAQQAAGGIASLPAVFASRHGELCRTVRMLHDLAEDEPPSPAGFSHSVHNAAAGVFSIARGDGAAATALAAGDETFLWALQEAVLRLGTDASPPVLLAYADEPVPPEYRVFAAANESAHALALRLSPGDDLRLEWRGNAGVAPSALPLSLAFLAWWLGHGDVLDWRSERLAVRGLRGA